VGCTGFDIQIACLVGSWPLIPNFLPRFPSDFQLTFSQIMQVLVDKGLLTQGQALESFAMMQASASPSQEQSIPQHMSPTLPTGGMADGSTQQQIAAPSQPAQGSTKNQMNPLQRATQAQDHLNTCPLNFLLAQSQQPENGSSFTSRVGQNLHPSGMGLPQGQGSLQQPTSSVPSANLQSSSAPSLQAPPQGAQHMRNLADVPLPQLSSIFNQLMRSVSEGEKNLHASSNSVDETDPQRQALRAKLANQKQFLLRIRDMISTKTGRPR
jgi:hypothetical protein